jgi:GT2 family glycosyltransferase
LIENNCAELALLTPESAVFGVPLPNPDVSVIVPLYKRFDFMEHQVLEFIRDPYFLNNAELIYVIDDPEIRMAVLTEAQKLFQLYEIPFRIVSGRRNRGFSGANNLGADYAEGEYLLFLNSDVIPVSPGWLEKMLDTLHAKNAGAVGAQLLYADGGIQHVGMHFEYLEEFQIWSNQHTQTGMPSYGSDSVSFEVPAVTGACVLIPKKIFVEIDGWDTGYLIGDFEDSHLCFAVRNAGYKIFCQPSALLTHLERQSFSGIGGDAFRMRMTICNAVRHQNIWNDTLDVTLGRN